MGTDDAAIDERDQRLAFAAALRAERDAAGLTQDALGQRVGVTDSRIGQWEAGHRIDPPSAFALERALGVDPGGLSHLLGYVPVANHAPVSVVAAIRADPRLDDRARATLEAAYRVELKASGASS